jgi:hypothetical protein
MPNNVNGIYIDEVYMESDGGVPFWSVSTFISVENPSNLSTDPAILTDEGFKWYVQVTNGTGGDLNGEDIKLTVRTKYLNNGTGTEFFDVEFTGPNSSTLADGNSIYFGISGLYTPGAGDLQVNDDTRYLSDQVEDPSSDPLDILVNTKFELRLENIWKDTIGTEDIGTSASTLATKLFLVDGFETGSFRRKPLATTIPNTTYSLGDWHQTSGNHLDASAFGDPHITTLDGETYKYDYLGAFRLFDNGNGFIINGFSEKGPARWSHKQYITKLFIQIEDKELLIDTGFRSNKVKVLENESNINYVDQELEFNKEALNYCYECRKYKVPINAQLGVEGHILFKPVRNKLTFKFKVKDELYKLELMNVNEYNLQPCRIKLIPIKFNINNCSGCIVDRKYSLTAQLENIKSVNKIEEPINYTEADLPPIEVIPSKLNKIFV